MRHLMDCPGVFRLSPAGRLVTLLCLGAACTTQTEALAARSVRAPAPPPYVNIELLLDISPSMDIGATPGDVAAMMHLTPCSVPGAVYRATDSRHWRGGIPDSGQNYLAYECKFRDDHNPQPPGFNGLKCPIPAARGVVEAPVMIPYRIGPRCTDLAPPASGVDYWGSATAGAPCAFACHWDRHQPPGATRDYYGLARSTIGQPPCYQKGSSPGDCAITLRLDVVKNAVVALVRSMQENDFRGAAKFSVGVFTFDNNLHAVYPPPATCGTAPQLSCQAGRDWPVALGSVGTAPDLPNTPDSGIQPSAGRNVAATDLPKALTVLANQYLTAAGTGATPDSPLKALFIVTDGLDDHFDHGRRRMGALDPKLCDIYKSMGFAVFVLYTPYLSLMNLFYLANVKNLAENDGPGTLSYNLRRCASHPERNFIAAGPGDAASVSRALQTFLSRTVIAD